MPIDKETTHPKVGNGATSASAVSSCAEQSTEPDWEAYAQRAQTIIDGTRWADTTPLTGQMLANAAKKAYEKHGKYPSADFALAQAQFESHMGTKGRSPTMNPFNVGEFDSGTVMTFETTQDGVDAYMNLMAKDYLQTRTEEELLQNFVNHNGNRYASNPNYESDLRGQIQVYRNRHDGTDE